MGDIDDLDNVYDEYDADSPNEANNDGPPEIEHNAESNNPSAPAGIKVVGPKRIVKNPRLKFDPDRLCGQRGIPIIMDHFKDMKFKGKGHETEDLDKLLATLEHWTHRLFPKMKFEDSLHQIEKLGKKRTVQTCLTKIRLDMPILNKDFVGNDDEDDIRRNSDSEPENTPDDAFNRLLGESQASFPQDEPLSLHETTNPETEERTKAQKLGSSFGSNLTEEQRKKMEYNKLLAAERRKATLVKEQTSLSHSELSEVTEEQIISATVERDNLNLSNLMGTTEKDETLNHSELRTFDMISEADDINDDGVNTENTVCSEHQEMTLESLIDASYGLQESNADIPVSNTLSGASRDISFEMMAANSPHSSDLSHIDETSVPDTLHIDETSVPGTLHIDETSVPDRLHIDETSVPDTLHIDETSVPDRLHIDETSASDSLHIDETSVSDTLHIDETNTQAHLRTEAMEID